MPATWRTRALAASLALCISACTALQPVDLPAETTPAPANAALWDSLEANPGENWFALLNDGPTALDWRLRAIDSATESIDMQTFLWNLDTSGRLVFQHLMEAAERGVQVKLLVDDTFLLGQDELLVDIANHEHIEYRVFNPYKRRANGFVTRQALNLAEFNRLDHRMHNKAMIIDNRVAIVGGRNIADEYFGLHDEANFRDLEVVAGGPVVEDISRSFDDYWNDPWSIPITLLAHIDARPMDVMALMDVGELPPGIHTEHSGEALRQQWQAISDTAHRGEPTLLADTPPRDNPALASEAPIQVTEALLDLLQQAKQEVIIVSAYLIPTPHLEEALAEVINRGVRVRVLTNSIRSNNHLTAHSAYRNHIKALMEQGVELHEVRIDASDRSAYMHGPAEGRNLALHAKVMVVDTDTVFIGSANLDPRSLRLNTEMGLLVKSEALNRELRSVLLPDFKLANAWELRTDEDGRVMWVSDEQVLRKQPAATMLQRIEDWLFAHLPLEDKL